MNYVQMIEESNNLETPTGVGSAPPTIWEITEFMRFLVLDKVSVAALEDFMQVAQPTARLRLATGLDLVMAGGYCPPRGGPHIAAHLRQLLDEVNEGKSAWDGYLEFLSLQPFTSGNGRAARMLWYWMMRFTGREHEMQFGFLKAYYHLTLGQVQYLPICRCDKP